MACVAFVERAELQHAAIGLYAVQVANQGAFGERSCGVGGGCIFVLHRSRRKVILLVFALARLFIRVDLHLHRWYRRRGRRCSTEISQCRIDGGIAVGGAHSGERTCTCGRVRNLEYACENRFEIHTSSFAPGGGCSVGLVRPTDPPPGSCFGHTAGPDPALARIVAAPPTREPDGLLADPAGRERPHNPKSLVVVPVVRIVPVPGTAGCQPLHTAGPLRRSRGGPPTTPPQRGRRVSERRTAFAAPGTQQPPHVPDQFGDVRVLRGTHTM